MAGKVSTTATSVRKSDQKAHELRRAFKEARKYEFGKFVRKVVKEIPLTTVREASAGDIPTSQAGLRTIGVALTDLREILVVGETADTLADVDFGGTEDRLFGLLGGETTPKLTVESETGSIEGGAMEVQWAASGNDPVAFQVSLPDIDVAADLTVTMRAKMASTTDTPVLDIDSYFDQGDTKVSDASGTVDEVTEDLVVTIAAADIPAGARTLGVEITPAAHTTDILYLYDVRVGYSTTAGEGGGGVLDKDTTPILETANGDTDGVLRLDWAAGDVDPIIFSVGLEDIDTKEDLMICVRGAMAAGGTDTTTSMESDCYFNEGDTKVEDLGSADFSTTYAEKKIIVAASDIPAAAAVLSVELTPEAHDNEALLVTRLHVEYTRKLPVSD